MRQVLYATIDNILETYQGIDWIYLWLNEHSMFGVDPEIALDNKQMKTFFQKNEKFYASESSKKSTKFLGVWAQAYIQKAYDYIQTKAPGTKVVVGGWGGEDQMGLLLKGLDQVLPKDIVFSMLNPEQGAKSHPDYFKQIAENRKIWAIPWLEGDASLWHLQPRVSDIRDHVQKATEDNLDGVLAIHWRTEEIKPNFETYTHFASNPKDDVSVGTIYKNICRNTYGEYASKHLAPLLSEIDESRVLSRLKSEVYYAYTPNWGRLDKKQTEVCKSLIKVINACLYNEKVKSKVTNLKWLKANYEFTLLLDEVGKSLEPAWKMRAAILSDRTLFESDIFKKAKKHLEKAPIEKMIKVFASKVRSLGELGELSSINQRVWGEYRLLKTFMGEFGSKTLINHHN